MFVYLGQINPLWTRRKTEERRGGVRDRQGTVFSSQSGDALDNAIRQNVVDNVAKLRSTACILGAAVGEKKLKVAGGITGRKAGRSIWQRERTRALALEQTPLAPSLCEENFHESLRSVDVVVAPCYTI